MKKLLVTSVTTLAYDNQVVTLENDSHKVVIHLKDQNEHNSFVQGQEVSISVEADKPAKASKKNKS